MRDISNFGNNLRDEIIEYRLEHETGYTLKIKFVDSGDETTARLCLYSKTGEFLSETDEFPFDPAGQRAIDSIKLIRGSSEGHEAEYEIKVLFRGGKDPVFCPVDDILTTLRKQLSNKVTIDLDNSKENESSVITSKIYSDFSKDKEPLELSESHISLDNIKMTAQNISIIADAESEEAKPTSVFVADVNDKKVTVHDLDVKNSININKAKIDALEVTGDVTVGHRLETKGLETKGSAAFRSDVSVNGTLMTTSLAAANNTLSVNDSSVSVIGNTSINGDITLTNSEREVSLTNDDFTINLMGNSDASVTNKKYVNDLVKIERERATNAENDISSSLDAKTTELRSAIEQEISDREEAVTAEKTRATAAESTLTTSLEAEVERATGKESEISSNLTTETTRANEAESALDEKITTNTNNITSLTSAIDEFKDKEQTDVDNLKGELDAESDRATDAESTLTANLEAEVTRATNKENELSRAIETEFNRADAAERANAKAIDTEKSRAETAETDLSERLAIIEGEGEGSIKSAVKAESTRAKAEESTIASKLDTEISRATEAESTLTNNLTAEASAREQGDTELETSIGTTNSNLEKAKKDLNNLITDEKNRAIGEETNLSTLISNEIENRKSAITQEVSDRNAAIAQERDRAVAAEGQLQKNITTEAKAIKADLATYAKSLELVGGKDTNYVYTFTLKDSNGTTLNEYSIDLPIESVVVGGTYDAGNKKVILTLDNGKEISFSVVDLIKGLVSDATFNEHANNKNNPHGVTAEQVGLGNVVNVGTEAVIKENSKNNVTSGAVYVHTSNKENPHSVTKAQVGLGNVDNTSDENKPISTATQAALNSKVDKVSDKSLILDTEITRLAGMSNGANKVEASTTNGKIKIDGDEVSVYNDTALSERISTIENNIQSIHSHANKDILDAISQDNINSWNSIEAAKADISSLQLAVNAAAEENTARKNEIAELKTRLDSLNDLDKDTIEKVKRVSTLGSIRGNDIY